MGVGGFKPITGTIGRGLGEFTLPGSNAAFCQSILQKGITGEALRLESLSYVLPREGQGAEQPPVSQQPVVVNLLMQLRAYCDESNTFLRQQHNLQLQLTRQLDQALSTARGSVSSQAQQIRRAVEGEMLQAGQFQRALSELTQQLKKNGKFSEARLTQTVLPGRPVPAYGTQISSAHPASSFLRSELPGPNGAETEKKPRSLHREPLTVVQKQEQGEMVREQVPSPRGLRRRKTVHGLYGRGEARFADQEKTGRSQEKRGKNRSLVPNGDALEAPVLSQEGETGRRGSAVTGENSREQRSQLPLQGTPESVSQGSVTVVSQLESGSIARPVSVGNRETHGKETERPGEKSLPVLRTFPAISHPSFLFRPQIPSTRMGMPETVGSFPPLVPPGGLGMPLSRSVVPSSYVWFFRGRMSHTNRPLAGPLILASEGPAWGRKEERFHGQGMLPMDSSLGVGRAFPGEENQRWKAKPLAFREVGSNAESVSQHEVHSPVSPNHPPAGWAGARGKAGRTQTAFQIQENRRNAVGKGPGQEGDLWSKTAWPLEQKRKNYSDLPWISSRIPYPGLFWPAPFVARGRPGLSSPLVHWIAGQTDQQTPAARTSSEEAHEPIYRTALSTGELARPRASVRRQPVSGETHEPIYRTALSTGELSRSSALAGPQPISSGVREPIYPTALPAGAFYPHPVKPGHQRSSFPARGTVLPSAVPELSRKQKVPLILPFPRPWAWDGEPMGRSEETVVIRRAEESGKSFFSQPFSFSFLSPTVPALERVAPMGPASPPSPMRDNGTGAPAVKRTQLLSRPWRGKAWNSRKGSAGSLEAFNLLSHPNGDLPTAWEEEASWDMVFRTSLDSQPEQRGEQEKAETASGWPMPEHLAFALGQGKTQKSALQKEGASVIRRGQGLPALLSLENSQSPGRLDATSQTMVHTAFFPEFSEGTPVSQPDRPAVSSQDAPKGMGQGVVYRLPARPQSVPQEKEESGEEVLRAQSVDAGYVSAMNAAYSHQAPESQPRPEVPGAISQETEERIVQQVLQDLNYNRMAAQVLERVERRLRTERRKIGR